MQNDQTNESTVTRSSSADSDQSIINRKKECRGIPGSFSANLGRRVSPSQTADGADATAPKSVKAIVAWLESSKDEAKSVQSITSDSQSKSSLVNTTIPKATFTIHSQSVAMAPDVEEYSLTLLKYRQYFTESPLGRCLDKDIVKAATSVRRIHDDPAAHSPAPVERDHEATEDGKSRSEEQVDGQRSSIESGTKSSTPKARHEQPGDVHRIIRDPEEVSEFWGAVRSYLWIPDEELEEADDPGGVASKQSCNSSSKTTMVACSECQKTAGLIAPEQQTSPHGKAQLEPATGTVVGRERKRLLSVEEKMLEIDTFLGTA